VPDRRLRGAYPHPMHSKAASGAHSGLLSAPSWRTIIRVPDHDDVAGGVMLAPRPDPQVEDVMQLDVRQQWRGHCPLRGSYFRLPPFPVLGNPALSHFWMRRRTLLSATRCSMNLTIHSCDRLSKKPRTSASSIQFTRLRIIPTQSASKAWC
jgi:hypothetical protein